ncbi:MAG: hypothetical protein WCI29_09310 [Actinomycetes bacterium]
MISVSPDSALGRCVFAALAAFVAIFALAVPAYAATCAATPGCMSNGTASATVPTFTAVSSTNPKGAMSFGISFAAGAAASGKPITLTWGLYRAAKAGSTAASTSDVLISSQSNIISPGTAANTKYPFSISNFKCTATTAPMAKQTYYTKVVASNGGSPVTGTTISLAAYAFSALISGC